MARRTTMSDVAREAHVSLMTVSRVVNHKGEVSPDTRRHVQAVIERLSYRPSNIARGLVTRRTGTLGLVVPDNANPFFSEVARAAESIAHAEGYSVFLCNTQEDAERELAVIESLEEKRVDGLVVCSPRLEDRMLREALSRHTAVVLVNRSLEDGPHPAVLVDDEMGGRLAAQHLLRAGPVAIGFLSGPAASHSGRSRARGFRRTLMAAGLPEAAVQFHPCAPIVTGGEQAALELLAQYPETTALFCYNDLVAVGALQAAVELGRRVPDDLAIVGFDDIPVAALVTPPLTTCRVDRDELGAQAVRLLLDQIAGQSATSQVVVLCPELIIRGSAP